MQEWNANTAQFYFTCGNLKPSTFEVWEFVGSDKISDIYNFKISLRSRDVNISYDDVVHKAATLYIERDHEFYPYSGIITDFCFDSFDGEMAHYTAHLRPRMYLLNLNTQSRVFQKKNIKQIIETVFKDSELQGSFTFELEKTYPEKEFVIQYKETDFNFVNRLLEAAGIWYFFKELPVTNSEINSVNTETCVFTDKPDNFKTLEGDSSIRFITSSGLNEQIGKEAKESIHNFSFAKRMTSRKVYVRNYNYHTPESFPEATLEVKTGTKGTSYQYGQDLKDSSEARIIAQQEVDRIVCSQEAINGEGNCRGFRAGSRFALEEHARDEFNTNYIISQVSHYGNHGQGDSLQSHFTYKNSFECITATTGAKYVPLKKTPTPSVNGIFTAMIEANGSSYAAIDETGRYKIRLPFDISSTPNFGASKYVRLAQPYSGAKYGMHFPSHEGTEMILACVEGDPNRPIGIGTVPNANTVSPVVSANKQQNIIRTAGGNEFLLDDTEGKQKIHLLTKGKNIVELDDDLKRIFVQSTSANKLLIDDKNKLVQLNANKHVLTMDYDKNDGIIITSAKGHIIKIDDKAERVTIQTKGKHTLDLDDKGGKITLTDGKGKSTVTLDSSNGIILDTKGKISINAAQDIDIQGANVKFTSKGKFDVNAKSNVAITGLKISNEAKSDYLVNGLNLSMKGKAKVNIEANATAEIKGKVSAALSGAQASVKGNALTSLSGAIVKIN